MLGVVECPNQPLERSSPTAYSRTAPDCLCFCSIQFLRDVRDFFGTSFQIVSIEDPTNPNSADLLYSCYGTGHVNANRDLA